MRFNIVLTLGFFLVACGSAPEKPAESPRSSPTAVSKPNKPRKKKARRAKKKSPYPQRCAGDSEECLPPAEWVQKLCDDIYPDLALHLFSPGTPWKRLYMRARAQPFNASGGMSLVGDVMQPGEEVIALRRRANDRGIRVGDTAGYDVLRWNGSCATIHDGDFTSKEPHELRHATIEWRRLGLPIRQALEAEPVISEVYEARRESCKRRSIGEVTAECEHSERRLADEVVRYVRDGGKLPKPEKLP